MPDWMIALAHSTQGNHGTYMTQPLSDTPIRAALYIALRSAWELQRYFAPVSRQCLASTSSRTPRGNPLKPVDLISLSGPTTTAPTRRPFSLLQRAIWCASSMNLSSQVLENIVILIPSSVRLLNHVPAKRPAFMIGPKVDICRKGTKPVSLQTTFFAKCRTGVFQIARFDGDSTRRVDP